MANPYDCVTLVNPANPVRVGVAIVLATPKLPDGIQKRTNTLFYEGSGVNGVSRYGLTSISGVQVKYDTYFDDPTYYTA